MNSITTYREGEWRTISVEDFEHRFFEVCKAHRAQGRALAFAFILFDRSHAYVRGALAQQNYWDALDEIAGRRLSVFSLDVRPPQTTGRTELRWMHVAETVRFADQHQDVLTDLFGEVTVRELPCVIFFQVDHEDLVDAFAVRLRADGLGQTYEELKGVIGAASDAVSHVTDENAEHAREVFHLVRGALDDYALKRSAIRVIKLARPVASVGGAVHFIRLILGL